MAWAEEHGQRPAAAALGEQVVGGLINLIQIGALLAVHLDVDVQLVHDARGVRVLERFMSHDVAPMTGRVADGEQYGFLLTPRFFQCLWAPGMPVHRVVSVLQQIGTGLVAEMIGVLGRVHEGSGLRNS